MRCLWIALLGAGSLATAPGGLAEKISPGILRSGQSSDQTSQDDNSKVHVLHVQGRVHMLVGAGPNITVQLGDNAVVLLTPACRR